VFGWARANGQVQGRKKTAGLLRLRWFAEHGWVQLVPGNLAFENRLDFAAAFARDHALGRPFLDCLGRELEQVAESGLASSEANCFCDSGFHSLRF